MHSAWGLFLATFTFHTQKKGRRTTDAFHHLCVCLWVASIFLHFSESFVIVHSSIHFFRMKCNVWHMNWIGFKEMYGYVCLFVWQSAKICISALCVMDTLSLYLTLKFSLFFSCSCSYFFACHTLFFFKFSQLFYPFLTVWCFLDSIREESVLKFAVWPNMCLCIANWQMEYFRFCWV